MNGNPVMDGVSAPASVAAGKRVLIVTDLPFWQQGVGSLSRIRSLCEALSACFSVTVLTLDRLPDASTVDALDRAGVRLCSVHDWLRDGERHPVAVTMPNVESLAAWRHEEHIGALRAFFAAQPPFDVVVFEYLWTAYLRDAVPEGTLAVLDTLDFMALRDYRFARNGMRAGVTISLAEEKSILDRFDVVLAIQQDEAQAFARLLDHAVVLCCPHGLRQAGAAAQAPGEVRASAGSELVLGFVGSDVAPNRNALGWFLAQVWPVVQLLPLRLRVYGTVCGALGAPPPGVLAVGQVADVAQAYRECDVMVNPVLEGGGLKIKSVEALAHGKPLLTTPEGAVGIEGGPASGLFVAQTRAGFADALIALWVRRASLPGLGARAQAQAARQFSFENAYGPLIQLVRGL